MKLKKENRIGDVTEKCVMTRYTQNNFKKKVVFKIVCIIKKTHTKEYMKDYSMSVKKIIYMYICIACTEKRINSIYPWTVGFYEFFVVVVLFDLD